ncbi:MAG: hypothetical protein EOS85_27405 [Mesorhizobium sp.]|nr:MAG: hypothetical protein EOS85_27405 [Mesorhizobium sp.]
MIHHSGCTLCEPGDVPVNNRHLDMVVAHLVLAELRLVSGSWNIPRSSMSFISI